MGFLLGIPSVVVEIHFLEKEMGKEGVVGQNIGLVKAILMWVALVRLPTHLH